MNFQAKEPLNPSVQKNISLHKSLEKNIAAMKEIFQGDPTIKVRRFENQAHPEIKCCLYFVDGMINHILINEHVIEPVMLNKSLSKGPQLLSHLSSRVLFSNEINPSNDINYLISEILTGNTVLFVDGFDTAFSISSRGWSMRSISEPSGEKVMQGPREGFTEGIIANLSMIRRKICNPNLKFKFMTIGKQTQTKICLCYIDGIVNRKILADLEKRLSKIDIDGILDANYIEELVKDAPYSPFKTTGMTERPDVVAAKLLEGRAAVVVDGTPVVMTVPFLFLEYFQSNDDYYSNYYFGSFSRLLRILGFFVTISLPAIYLALVVYHQELLPTKFLLNISESRLGLPFPTLFEMIILILAFELIREGGAKVPSNIGSTLSIVGGLVLGQASVEAKLVSIPVVIIVAFTGITGLMIPQLKGPILFLRIGSLLLSAVMGIFGYFFAIAGFIIHLASLHTFGIPYTSSLSQGFRHEWKDTIVRAPWFLMRLRPKFLSPSNRIRQSKADPDQTDSGGGDNRHSPSRGDRNNGKSSGSLDDDSPQASSPQTGDFSQSADQRTTGLPPSGKRSLFRCLVPFLLLMPMFLTGCMGAREINDMAILSGAALDWNPVKNLYTVTGEIVNKSTSDSGPETGTTGKIIRSEGLSIADAIRSCAYEDSRQPHWGHAKVFAVSRQLAEQQGIAPLLDYVMRNYDSRLSIFLLVADLPQAGNLLQLDAGAGDSKFFDLEQMLLTDEEYSGVYPVKIFQGVDILQGEGRSLTIPVLAASGKQAVISGTAIFNGDKLTDILSQEDTLPLLFLQNQIKEAHLTVGEEVSKSTDADAASQPDNAKPAPDEIRGFTADILKSKTKVTAKESTDGLSILVSIKTETGLSQLAGGGDAIGDEELERMEALLSQTIKTRCEALITRVQKNSRSDIFGFGQAVKRAYPERWETLSKDWNEKGFPALKVKVDCEVSLDPGESTRLNMIGGDQK